MASVDRNALNPVEQTTDVHANTLGKSLYNGHFVFVVDAHPAMAATFPIGGQQIDATYGRAINTGRGVVGEGGIKGPGVVGIAGGVIASPVQPRSLNDGPQLGRDIRAGVIGYGSDPALHGERGAGDAAGVLGIADRSVGVAGWSTRFPGVFGFAREHAGVYGAGNVGVIGDGRNAHVGVQGSSGDFAGVYGHVDFSNPAANMVGVFGAAALVPGGTPIGFAGMFAGDVATLGHHTVTGNLVVWGTKSAAARHRDGTHRLMYCVESPDAQFEDFGEAELVDGTAEVVLDADFVALADTRRYHVFVTPYGDCGALHVARRTRTGFRVRESARGRSNVAFSWRVVARRKDVDTERFARVDRPVAPKLPPAPDMPALDAAPFRSIAPAAPRRAGRKRA